MDSFSIFAPAKLNLFLAITGRRADGFHDLVSVVSKVDFGDTLRVEPAPEFTLACDQPDVPCDETNLVLKTARAFAAATNWKGGASFFLEKRIPMGAGLGGGSTDAVAALLALNRLAGPRCALSPQALAGLAAQVGSDCSLFLQDGAVIMRGRGELIAPLPVPAAQRLRGRRVLLFKPAFGIATPWAYAQLAAGAPHRYIAPTDAEALLAAWLADANAPAESLLLNTMEPPAFAKFVALPVLIDQLRAEFALQPRMSGSGSACFALLEEARAAGPICAAIRAAWGDSAFIIEARLT